MDVKPSNVLLTADGQLKIGDFGLTAPLGELHDGVEGETRGVNQNLSEKERNKKKQHQG